MKSSAYRSLGSVPRFFLGMLIFSLILQLAWHEHMSARLATREFLTVAPESDQLRMLALGEPEVLAKVLMLWIQSFDNQPGISLPLQTLNYDNLIGWLQKISVLDDRSQYPLYSASYIYAVVKDPVKQRQIFDFIEQRFRQYPNRYWRWLAHASISARHSLEDNDLALYYAKLLREHATGSDVPEWARQMEIGILQEKGEYESARLLIGGLLNENRITDPQELYFLNERLKQLKPEP